MVQVTGYSEEYGEVHTAKQATFVGLYDGHGGVEASEYVSKNLYRHLLSIADTAHRIDESIIREAFEHIEAGVIGMVRDCFNPFNEVVLGQGSCCLVGIIHECRLWIANLGDSRAVLGKSKNGSVVAEQLTVDHNVKEPGIRQKLQAEHPDDPHIVKKVNNVYRVRGRIQVTRAIGDAYLKYPELAVSNRTPRFYLEHPITRPVLSAEPDIRVMALEATHRFVIFATDGLWSFLTNEEAVRIVSKNPRKGIAKKLIIKALKRAAREANTSYSAIKTMKVGGEGGRRDIHDDISVVVLFIDLPQMHPDAPPVLSVRGFRSRGAAIPFEF